MKYSLSILFIVLTIVSVTAREFSYTYQDQKVTYTVVDEAAKTCRTRNGSYGSSGNNSLMKGELIIPETVSDGKNDYTVVAIGQFSFAYCSYLTSVTLPNSISTISNSAFRECKELKTINIPSSTSSIGAMVFYACFALASIDIPNSVTSIGENTFDVCTSLTSISIPNSIHSISDGLFSSCSNLVNVDLPNTITSIGKYAFSSCKSLVSFTIPDSVATIGAEAFSNCTALKSLTAPDKMPVIDNTSFRGIYESCDLIIPSRAFSDYLCSQWSLFKNINSKESEESFIEYSDEKLNYVLDPNTHSAVVKGRVNIKDDEITIPGSITYIDDSGNAEKYYITAVGYRALNSSNYEITYITSLTFDSCNKLTRIGDYAFAWCSRLTELILPPAVETIGTGAFQEATALSTVIMGCNVKKIGDKTFDRCPLRNIYITAQTPPTVADNVFSDYTGILHLQGAQAVHDYAHSSMCWGEFDNQEMAVASDIEITASGEYTGKAGDTIVLNTTMTPAKATLKYIFWRSTNPEIATVDDNGVVTLHTDLGADTHACKIIGETLYYNGPVAVYNVLDNTSSDVIDIAADSFSDSTIDYNMPIEVFNLNGMKTGTSIHNLPKGIYIVRQGNIVEKLTVK